jgi:hypothetical protein
LSIFLPDLFLLQVIRSPVFPEWGGEQFRAWPVVCQPEEAEQIKLYLKSYQELADLHGGEGILSSLSHQWAINDSLQESRLQIQSALKGKEPAGGDVKQSLRLEAALFLELARDLDEKEIELVSSLSQVDRLEGEFREVLGIADEEGLEEFLETTAPPLVPQESQLLFMLPRRIGSWFRLFAFKPPESSPFLVSVTHEIQEELLDPLQTQWERNNQVFEPYRVTLATLPPLGHLSAETFLTLNQELRTSETLTSYWRSLEHVVTNPLDSSLRESLEAVAETLQNQVKAFCQKANVLKEAQIHLKMTYLEDCTHANFWENMDKTGYEGLEKELRFPGKATVLYLEESTGERFSCA